jgi:hypothetical protein
MTARRVLPNRRASTTYDLLFQKRHKVTITTSLTAGHVSEVFISTEKDGTALADMAHDAAIILSVAFQHSISVAALAHSIKRDDDGQPASLVGLVLDSLLKLEAERQR